MLNSSGQGLSSSFLKEGRTLKRIKVFDCRFENIEPKEELFETSRLDFNDFLRVLHKKFTIRPHETSVLVTTDRTVLDFDKFARLQDATTLYLLQRKDQALAKAVEEHIMFLPHYDTLVHSGMYEYHASKGHNPLPYALAELIDNALSATSKNTGVRTIEIRMLLDETLGKPAVVVLDNGCGMTSKQLNNWAVYRNSKFVRENSIFGSKEDAYVRPDPVPRSLNSDISYFGVGGKNAAFYIGDSTRMISKSVGSPDVHELILSKEDFENKEKNKEDIYSGYIKNRKLGDSSHVRKNDERFLHALIAEESGKESFTAVVITGVRPEHVSFLKQDFDICARELAHTYHYYLHGVNGNDMSSSSTISEHPKIDIQITLREKLPRCPRMMNIREVDDDMQTLYINAAADMFEFRISTDAGKGTVEGILRYHPFLYDKETYPEEQNKHALPDDEDNENESEDVPLARGKRPIFECFWNGRLIPYTTISEFDWCAKPKAKAKLPAECYSRFSGVLFTNDTYMVSTNKLTYVDLELKLKKKETIFTRVVNGQKQRTNIQFEFTKWLQNCHEKLDKQVKFMQFKEIITREDVHTKKMQHPWAIFSSIEWDGKKYKAGQRVKSQKTVPIIYGTVNRFLLYGKYDGDVFATGGEVELTLEPKALYDTTKIILISKIDRNATDEAIERNIDNDLAKLPEKLTVDWTEGVPWPQNAVRPAGTPLGPVKVQILNRNKESISRMPSVGHGQGKKLCVELQVIHHGTEGDKVESSIICQYSPKWGFWFKKYENLTKLGKYTLLLNTIISGDDTKAKVFGGKPLPSYKLNFTMKEGSAESFTVDAVSSTLRVGVTFNIPLQLKDRYEHLTTPPPDLRPVLQCSGLELSYETVDYSGTTFVIKNVKAKGRVQNYQQSKTYDVKVTLPGLKKDSQTFKIGLLPGNPHILKVTPEEVTVENGDPVNFHVEVHDEAGNITANPKQIVRCQIQSLPLATTDCSSTGAGQVTTKPINLKIIKGEPRLLKVHFDLPSWKSTQSLVKWVKVLPSTRVCRMELCSQDDENLILRNNDKIDWPAGGLLENLFFKLYDEAGREVPLTAEIAATIKVNWTGDEILEDLLQGKLPDVQVPTQVQEQRFYQVSYKDQSVSVSFTITPRPDEPTRLKATLLQSTVKLGETLPGNINLELVDQYDNVTKTLTSSCMNHIKVEGEGLDKSDLAFKWQGSSSSVTVTGLRFESGTPGSREMCFTYKEYVERVIVEVTAGVPAQLKLASGPEQPLQVLNDHGIPTAFLIQLCDKWGNPSPDQRVVVELRSSPQTLKVTTNVTSQPVNAEGKAAFTVKSVSGPKGYYQLVFKGSFNKKPIHGPSVNLTVIPNPNKPVKLSVEYDTDTKFPAGGTFPVFSMTVVSDEGSPITTFNPAAASMYLWKDTSPGKRPPDTATELKCSKPKAGEKNDCFRFRDKEIPEQVGKHIIQFSLLLNRTEVLFSDQIAINVVGNQPFKLGPDSQPPTPVVSYTKDIANRTLVEDMTLRIMDSYGNPAGQNLDGRVEVFIKNTVEDGNKVFPLFENKTSRMQFSLTKGNVHITRLAIMENSPGEDGNSYILLFKAEVSVIQTPLLSFELPFHFYNDVANQQTISELSKKRHELKTQVAVQQDFFNTYAELLKELTDQHLEASKKEAIVRSELIKSNIDMAQCLSIPSIDRLLAVMNSETERIQNMPRRVCSIHDQFSGQQDVLGMVCHLALVEDDDVARVISWHIRGEMDCVITKTTEAARRIYANTRGMQQVLALDSVYIPPGIRPLPHISNGRMVFHPQGNPVFARDLLIYPNNQKSCDIVFRSMLGDTILMDDLDSANNYRRMVVQNKVRCPCILTRQGDRISAIGKFGGAHNKAPPIQALKVFAAPLPREYHIVKNQIELLNRYKSALKKKEDAQKEREDHTKELKSPDMLRRQHEMEERKRQLNEIEKQLVSTPVRPPKRGPGSAGEPSGIITKRARQNPR